MYYKKVDFLLNVEVKTRELESYCLLKKELEKRGYSVAISSCIDNKGKIHTCYSAEVLVSNGIDYWSNVDHALGRAVKCKKIIETPWEQNVTSCYLSRLKKRDAIGFHCAAVAWGEIARNRMIEMIGLNSEQVFVCGHPAMDLCRPIFSDYYISRLDIAREFGLDFNKQWILFNSSFVLEHLGKDKCIEIDNEYHNGYYQRSYDIEILTKSKIIEWFDRYLNENDDKILIYRPHPAEKITDNIKELEKHKNFKIIRDYSVRQWMFVSDKILTWISTSIVEAYFMKKRCIVLRPIDVPSDLDIESFTQKNVYVTTYDQMVDSLDDKETPYPFLDDDIKKYYYHEDKYCFELLADLCEKVYNDSSFIIPEEIIKQVDYYQKNTFAEMNLFSKIRRVMRGNAFIYRLYSRFVQGEIVNNHLYKNEIVGIEKRLAKLEIF